MADYLMAATVVAVARAHSDWASEDILRTSEALIERGLVRLDADGKLEISEHPDSAVLAPRLVQITGDSDAAKVARSMQREAVNGHAPKLAPTPRDVAALNEQMRALGNPGDGTPAARAERSARRAKLLEAAYGRDDADGDGSY